MATIKDEPKIEDIVTDAPPVAPDVDTSVIQVLTLDDMHSKFKAHYDSIEDKCKKYEELLKFNEALPGLYKKLNYLEDMWERLVIKEEEKKRSLDLF